MSPRRISIGGVEPQVVPPDRRSHSQDRARQTNARTSAIRELGSRAPATLTRAPMTLKKKALATRWRIPLDRRAPPGAAMTVNVGEGAKEGSGIAGRKRRVRTARARPNDAGT